jgi:hypothetical protein
MKIKQVRVGRYVYRSPRSAKGSILFPSILLLLIAGCIIAAAADAPAGDFDGSRPLSGTTGNIIEINPYKIISDIDPDTVGIPRHFLIDFNTKTLHPAPDSLIKKTIAFHSLVHIENKVILQGVDEGVEGVDDGLAWSLAISKKDGKAVLSASGDKVAYVVFGVCAPR